MTKIMNAPMAATFTDSARDWDRLLTHQVSLLAMAEMSYLASLPEWSRAKTVLDVGCGNGDYLSRLHQNFPLKSYTGIDSSPELIEIARSRHGRTATFHLGDILHSEPAVRPDAIIARFLVQHLADPATFFARVRGLAAPGAVLMIIEPCRSESSVIPEIGSLSSLIERYEQKCRELGSARALVCSPHNLEEPIRGSWRLAREHSITSRHSRASWTGADVAHVLHGWVGAIERARIIEADYRLVRRDIDDWLSGSGWSVTLALNLWVLAAL